MRRMSLAIPRHNINLDRAELGLLLRGLLGVARPDGGRQAFEDAFAAYLGLPRCFALESSRQALMLLLAALDLPPGARVVVPAYTFYTLPLVVQALGLEPVPAPVDPRSYGIDPRQLEPCLEGASALILIHPFGQVAAVEEIAALCARHGVTLIEDGSQATGASLDGVRVGAFGAASTFSLVHGKNLQTFGGGLLACRDGALAQSVAARLTSARPADDAAVRGRLSEGLRSFLLARRRPFSALVFPPLLAASEWDRGKLDASFAEARHPLDPGRPPRLLSDLQGRLGCLELERLQERNARRADNALLLLQGLRGLPGLGLPVYDPRAINTFNSVAVRVSDARATARGLLRRGVDTRDDYMDWLTPAPQGFGEVLYLPNHPGMGPRDVERVVRAVGDCLA